MALNGNSQLSTLNSPPPVSLWRCHAGCGQPLYRCPQPSPTRPPSRTAPCTLCPTPGVRSCRTPPHSAAQTTTPPSRSPPQGWAPNRCACPPHCLSPLARRRRQGQTAPCRSTRCSSRCHGTWHAPARHTSPPCPSCASYNWPSSPWPRHTLTGRHRHDHRPAASLSCYLLRPTPSSRCYPTSTPLAGPPPLCTAPCSGSTPSPSCR